MKKMYSLKELNVDIISGQILNRVTVKNESEENIVERRKVIIPKAIMSDGSVDVTELPEEKFKVAVDKKRITEIGDIVIKLSTPYDAALIDEKSENCVIPSFCAAIRCPDEIDSNYLLAFLNSSFCKEQLRRQVAGTPITVLSIGKVSNVKMPKPTIDEQKKIGMEYMKTQEKLNIIKQIVELELKRNDVRFKELAKNYE